MIGCLLDMDGVLCDFVGAMCKAHDKEDPFKRAINLGKYDMAKMWKMEEKTFWKPANFVDFWASMDKMSDAGDLVKFVENKFGKENVAILTAPSEHSNSIIGKMKWIANNYPQFKRRVILTPAKDFLAHHGNVLIDDRDENVDNFKKAGGRAVLMPRPWNSQHSKAFFSLANVEHHIHEMNIVRR